MTFCSGCGTKNAIDSAYCGNCGSYIQPEPQQQTYDAYQPSPQEYQRKPRSYQQTHSQGQLPQTGWLTFVIVVNWIIIILGGIAGVIFFFLFPPVGIFLLALVGLVYWLVKELTVYNNNARIIQIILIILGVLGDLSEGDVIGLIIGILIFYALVIDRATVALFQPSIDRQPHSRFT